MSLGVLLGPKHVELERNNLIPLEVKVGLSVLPRLMRMPCMVYTGCTSMH
jgi:hypothetical protein